MKLQDLLRHVADNVEAGRLTGYGLLFNGREPRSASSESCCLAFSMPACYSIAPATHIVNGFEVPVAMSEVLPAGSQYFLLELSNHTMYSEWAFGAGSKADHFWVKRGLCFHTAEATQQNAKAILGIDPSTPIEEC